MTTWTIHDFFNRFATHDDCLEHLMRTRHGSALDCPKCGKHSKFHRVKKRPVYECQWCGYQLSPMKDTPFEKSRTPLQKWFYAMYLFTTSRHGVPAKELQRQLGVTYKTAWRMGHELRKYMDQVDGDPPLSGVVEIDETYVGGRKKGHIGKLKRKTAVIGMVSRGGDVMAKVVPSGRKVHLTPLIEANVTKGSTIHTDEYRAYHDLPTRGYSHATVEHSRDEWVRGNVHTNTIEGYWSRFKNSIRGTHIHVSKKHMQKYLAEFEFRFNMRKQPHLMFDCLLKSF